MLSDVGHHCNSQNNLKTNQPCAAVPVHLQLPNLAGNINILLPLGACTRVMVVVVCVCVSVCLCVCVCVCVCVHVCYHTSCYIPHLYVEN